MLLIFDSESQYLPIFSLCGHGDESLCNPLQVEHDIGSVHPPCQGDLHLLQVTIKERAGREDDLVHGAQAQGVLYPDHQRLGCNEGGGGALRALGFLQCVPKTHQECSKRNPVSVCRLQKAAEHICHFWCATIFFRHVKGTPKKRVNLRQKFPRDKSA